MSYLTACKGASGPRLFTSLWNHHPCSDVELIWERRASSYGNEASDHRFTAFEIFTLTEVEKTDFVLSSSTACFSFVFASNIHISTEFLDLL